MRECDRCCFHSYGHDQSVSEWDFRKWWITRAFYSCISIYSISLANLARLFHCFDHIIGWTFLCCYLKKGWLTFQIWPWSAVNRLDCMLKGSKASQRDRFSVQLFTAVNKHLGFCVMVNSPSLCCHSLCCLMHPSLVHDPILKAQGWKESADGWIVTMRTTGGICCSEDGWDPWSNISGDWRWACGHMILKS